MIDKIGNSNVVIDHSLNRVTFLDARFYSDDEGNFWPSVTTINSAYPKGPEYFAWLKKVGDDADEIRDEAGRRGSVVHDLTEKYDNGNEVSLFNEDGYIGFKLNEWAMFSRYVEFRDRFSFDIDYTEINLMSSALGFAGTLDRVITFKDEKILVDIKTGNSIYPFHWLQLAAYRKLLKDQLNVDVDKVAILWLNAKTRTDGTKGAIQGSGWQLITREDGETAKDWSLFLATFELWKAENNNLKPKQLSYQINFKKNVATAQTV